MPQNTTFAKLPYQLILKGIISVRCLTQAEIIWSLKLELPVVTRGLV